MVRAADEDDPFIRPNASVGEFDCRALTTNITVDNSASEQPVPFAVRVSSWVPSLKYPADLFYEDYTLGARARKVLSVPLADNAYNRVSVLDSGNVPVAERTGSCGDLNLDPRATIAEFDCRGLTTTVSLDNSRSTVPVVFEVSAYGWGPFTSESTPLNRDVQLAAGSIAVLQVPLARNARTEVAVAVAEPLLSVLDRRAEHCGDNITATIEPRCTASTAIVTLDNRQSAQAAWVTVTSTAFEFERQFSIRVVLAAGESRVIQVPLVANGYNAVDATAGPGGYVLAIEDFMCGRSLYDPQASFGHVDCRNMTVPVTLDNTQSSSWASYAVSNASGDSWLPEETAVPAGGTQVIVVHIPPQMTELRVWQYSEDYGSSYLDSVDTRCSAPAPEATRARLFGPATGSISPAAPSAGTTTGSELASSGAEVAKPLLLALALIGGGWLLLRVRRREET